MLNLLLKGVAMCAPLLLVVWGVCWWRRSPGWILCLSLLAASLVSYLICSRWQLVKNAESREDASEMTGRIELYLWVCQVLASGLVLFPALWLQGRRRRS